MRLAIGLFATLAALAGAASADSPSLEMAGLYTPLPTASVEGLLRVGVKIKCTCGKNSVEIVADYCPQAMKPTCECSKTGGPPAATCAKARQ
jgi:hypothetical protein